MTWQRLPSNHALPAGPDTAPHPHAAPPEAAERGPARLASAAAAELAETLGELRAAGAPLPDGLEVVASELKRGRLRRIFLRLAQRLREGSSLDEALQALGVPPHVGLLLGCGPGGRAHPEALSAYVSVTRQVALVPRQLMGLMAYPLVILTLLGFVVMVFARLAAEGVTMLSALDGQIPPATLLLAGFAQAGFAPYAWAAAMVLLATLAARLLRPWAMASLLLIQPLPLIGPLLRWNHTRHFAALLHALLAEQLPLPEALRAAGMANADAALRLAVRRTAQRVEAGLPFSAALEREPLLAALAPLVAWGEQTGMLAAALQTSAELYGMRVESRMAMIRALLAPLLLVLVTLTLTFTLGSSVGAMLAMMRAYS
ncbi:MAG: type II secretion system F family protein [Pirellulales bacterium]|nr:type II secretion system F family protein [Pirellulales bacterium]